MVLGLLGFCGGITSLPAVICSHLSLRAIRRSGGELTGRGMAVAGLVLGYLGLAGLALVAVSIGMGAKKAAKDAALAGLLYEVSSVAVPTFPPLPALAPLGDSGLKVGQLHLQGGTGPGGSMELRIYMPAGNHAAGSLRCVLVAPAGTTLLSGTDIGSLDPDAYHDECLPYAEAGMAVVMYSLDGNLDDEDSEDREKTRAAYERFRDAQAGLVNARNALEFALARMPEVNREKIFAAGHSSAATLSLLFGEHEPRLAGCVAYAPATDVETRLKEVTDNPVSNLTFPECKSFLKRSSPKTHADQLKIPAFVFHAANDKNVPAADSRDFAAGLKARGADITFREVPDGGHYDAMIDDGIPAGIKWMKSR
jgi:dienelactone hydrolase